MSTDTATIRNLIEQLLTGWLAGSGKMFAKPFGRRARFVAFDGTVLTGPAEIADFHQRAFEGHLRETALELTIHEVRPVTAGVWLIFSTGGIKKLDGTNAERTGESVQTFLCKEEAGKTRIEAFQNTRVRPITDERSAGVWRTFDENWRTQTGS